MSAATKIIITNPANASFTDWQVGNLANDVQAIILASLRVLQRATQLPTCRQACPMAPILELEMRPKQRKLKKRKAKRSEPEELTCSNDTCGDLLTKPHVNPT